MNEQYEPELMYALDSKSEYADYKNVYNVSGNDVLYCPICLGRVKLWNGQDKNKVYKKQRCFHHIDGMCSQESKIHFAYKTWLLEKGNKFQVNETIYEVESSEIEKTFHTKFGDYRPDIVVKTTDNHMFYIEIANSNKKNEDYILKWDELGCDVLELNVNDQLGIVSANTMPVFKLIYSSTTGECYIKHYVRQDYDEFVTERKIYWKRNDLLNYKIQWEKLDWFWRQLQDFYTEICNLESLIEVFESMDESDQRFVCSKIKGKHSKLTYDLEMHYTDKNDKEKANLKYISKTIRNINKKYGLSSSDGRPYLCRNYHCVEFKTYNSYSINNTLWIKNNTTPETVYNYFCPIIEKYFDNISIQQVEEKRKEKVLQRRKSKIKKRYEPVLKYYKNIICNSRNNAWHFHYRFNNALKYGIYLDFFDIGTYFEIDTTDDGGDLYQYIKSVFAKEMNALVDTLKNDADKIDEIRIMEER